MSLLKRRSKFVLNQVLKTQLTNTLSKCFYSTVTTLQTQTN